MLTSATRARLRLRLRAGPSSSYISRAMTCALLARRICRRRAGQASRPYTLDVGSHNNVGDAGAAALASSNWRCLTSLGINENALSASGGASLAAGPWADLQELWLTTNDVGAAGVAALARARWPNLRALHISNTNLGAAGVSLAVAAWRGLQRLRLAFNGLSPTELAALAPMHWPGLKLSL